jgi:hypothetical protein
MPLYASIPQFASIPHPRLLKFLKWARDLTAHQLAYCSGTRTTTKYITATGTAGNGLGTLASPRQCPTPADVATYVLANIGGSVEFLLKRGDRFRVTDAAKTANISINQTNAKLGWYAATAADTSLPPPEITGFKAAYGASGWTDEGSGVYSRTDATTIYGLRGGSSAVLEDQVRTPYDHFSSGGDAAARLAALKAHTRRSWYKEGTTLYVQVLTGGTTERNLVEAAIATGYGVTFSGDKCLVEGIVASGFMESSSGSYCLANQTTGTNVAAAKDCKALWGKLHSGGKINAGEGGGDVWAECLFGLCAHDPSNGSTQFVSYAINGLHESYRRNCSYLGPVRTATSIADAGYGSGSYGHTGGVVKAGLVLDIGSNYLTHDTHMLAGASDAADLPVMADKRDYAACRCFFIEERGTIYGFPGAPFGNNYLRINPNLRCIGTASNQAVEAFSTAFQLGAAFNPVYEFDIGNRSVSTFWSMFNPASAANYYDLVHGLVTIKTRSTQGWLTDHDGASTGGQNWNTVWINDGGCANVSCGVGNADARTTASGAAGCAYFQMQRATSGGYIGYNAHGAIVELDSPIVGRNPAAELVGAGVVCPVDLQLEYDHYGNRRYGLPTIGPFAPQDFRERATMRLRDRF